MATVVDSLQENWSKFDSVYLFPPFPILTKVIQKIIMEKARGILIIPNWDSQFWYKHVERIQEDSWDFACSEETVLFISGYGYSETELPSWPHTEGNKIFRGKVLDLVRKILFS